MKFGLLPITFTVSIGTAVVNAFPANAATFFGDGTGGDPKTSDEFVIQFTPQGEIKDFELSIIGLELTPQTSLMGTISQDNTEMSEEFEITSSGDFSQLFSGFNGQERSSSYTLSLTAILNEETEVESPTFDFSYWKLGLSTDGEACDELEGTLATGEFWANVSCYRPAELETDGEETFIELTANAGIIKDLEDNHPTLVYQDPAGESRILQGSRLTRARGNSVASTLDIEFTIEGCDLVDDGGNVIGIANECRNEHGELNIEGELVFDDDGSSEIFQIASAQGETTGLPPQAVPEPSFMLGLLATIGIVSRKKRG